MANLSKTIHENVRSNLLLDRITPSSYLSGDFRRRHSQVFHREDFLKKFAKFTESTNGGGFLSYIVVLS